MARLLGVAGDVLGVIGVKQFPFNSFRLKNIMTEYIFDVSSTLAICGPDLVPQAVGIKRTADWFLGQSQVPAAPVVKT